MTSDDFSVFEIRGDRVKAIAGDRSDAARSSFAREAETLQSRAFLIGSTMGMSAVSAVAAVHGQGGLAFRFAQHSQEGFDAKGMTLRNGPFSASSVLAALDADAGSEDE